jgi:hypothetical protein
VWTKLLATGGMLQLSESDRFELLSSMRDQAETLHGGIEVRLQANHLLSNLIGVVLAGIVLDDNRSDAWRARTPWLLRELASQVHPDGGHEERSPMYHALLLESLLDLSNVCRALPERVPAGLLGALDATTARMLDALAFWTHPDGRIALFADSGFDIAPEPAALEAYAASLGIVRRSGTPPAALPDTGYLRLGEGGFRLIASVAGPAPAHQPGHAHCDALAFELSIDRDRVVTDTGLYEYVPGSRRDLARATASHATAMLDESEQSEIWSAHRVGGRARVEWGRPEPVRGALEAWATCRPWSLPRTLHRRHFRIEEGSLVVIDVVEGPCDAVRLTLPIDPRWRVELEPDGITARLESRDGADAPGPAAEIRIDLPGELEWRVELGPFFPGFGREIERPILVGRGRVLQAGVTRIRRVEPTRE